MAKVWTRDGFFFGAALTGALSLIGGCGDDGVVTSESATGSSTGDSASASASASATASASASASASATDTASGSATDSASASASATDGTSTSDGTATSGTGSTTAVETSGVTQGSTTSGGPTCQDECVDGVCVGDICCPVDSACGDECCGDGQVCAFQTCVDPGDACVTASECPADAYCDYSLGEAGDKVCGGGGSPDTGKCMPNPPLCMMGEMPDDPNAIACLPTCDFENDGVFESTLKYAWGGASVMMPPIITHLDDDNCDDKVDGRDIPDIIWASFAGGAYNNNGTLHAYSVIDGQLVKKWSQNPQSDRIWPGKAIAAGDLDGDPGAEIVTCTENGRARAFGPDGGTYWVANGITYCDSPAIVDLDGDGDPEVLVEGAVLNGQTGAVKATFPVKNPASWWRERVTAADLNDDGVLEIITASAAFNADGTLFADSKLRGTFPAVADLDGDGKPEVVVIANLGKGSNVHHLHVWAYDANAPDKAKIVRQGVNINGPLAPALCPASSNGYSGGGGPPTIAEFNGDGHPDVGVAGGIGYAVFDGALLMDPNTANPDTLVWIKQTQDCSSSFTGSSVYDFNGNGRAEVVYADEEVLRIYQGSDGSVLEEICNTSGTLHEYPLVTDLDHDGHADLVVASNDYSGFVCPMQNSKTTGVRVFSNIDWTRTRTQWNQHTYHVTKDVPLAQFRSESANSGHYVPKDTTQEGLAVRDSVAMINAA